MDYKKSIALIEEAFNNTVRAVSSDEWRTNHRFKRKTIAVKKLLTKTRIHSDAHMETIEATKEALKISEQEVSH